jgi:hypothetical protein
MKTIVVAVLLLLAGMLFATVVQADQPGHLVRATDLRAEPYIDAELVVTLPVNTQLDVLQRKGGWYQVKAQTHQGWVYMGNVRFAAIGTGKQSGWLGTGRNSARWSTTTTGIRGLSEEQLKQARPDMEAVKSLTQYQASATSARQFAIALGLKARPVSLLPVGNK